MHESLFERAAFGPKNHFDGEGRGADQRPALNEQTVILPVELHGRSHGAANETGMAFDLDLEPATRCRLSKFQTV